MTELLGPATFFHSSDWGDGDPLVVANFLSADNQSAQLGFWWRGFFWTAPSGTKLAWLECRDEFMVARDVVESLTPELFTADLAKVSQMYRVNYIDAIVSGDFPPKRIHGLLDLDELDERAVRTVDAFDECCEVIRDWEQNATSFDEIIQLAETRLGSLDMDQRFELALFGRFMLNYYLLFPDPSFRNSMRRAANLAISLGLRNTKSDETP
jgi:hypothetical protein